MFDAYKVSVKLALVNGVSTGLALIAKELEGVNRSVAGTQMRFTGLRTEMEKIQKMGLIGGGMAAAGFGMLSMLKAPIEEATQWERIMASMRQKGLGDAQIADAQKFMRANDIYGVSLLERAKIFNEAQGSFRESGMSGTAALDAAKTMTPVLAGYKLAMATLDDKSHAAAEGSFTQLNKIVELMGGLGNTGRATDIVGGVFKAVQGSGKMVSERDIRQFITQGGSAVSGLSLSTIFGALEPQMGEFGGSQMGTGMNTAYSLLTGTQSKPSKLFVRKALKMGLWDQNNLAFNSQGGIKEYKGQPLKPEMAGLMHDDTLGFVKKLMEIYKDKGITSQADRERENDILLGRTGAKVYNKFMLQLAVMEHSLDAYNNAHNPTQVNDEQKDSIMQKSIELQKQWNDSLLNFGLITLPYAKKALDAVTRALTSFTDFAKANPGTVRLMTTAFISLAGALAFGGTVILLSASLKGLGVALNFLGIGGPLGIAAIGESMGAFGLAIGIIGAALRAFTWVTIALAVARALGLPETDKEKGDHDVKKGNWWSASADLPAGDFIKAAINNIDLSFGPKINPAMQDRPNGYYDLETKKIVNKSVMDDYRPPEERYPRMIHNTIMMPDGRVLASIVTKEQAKAVSAPQTGVGRADLGLAPIYPGMNIR